LLRCPDLKACEQQQPSKRGSTRGVALFAYAPQWFASSAWLADTVRPMSAFPPLNHLDRLEAESIHILREVAAECRKPVMLYSIGKDSSVLLHLRARPSAPAQAAVSAAARRHDLEVPRDDRAP
jgi:hypothetical protein